MKKLAYAEAAVAKRMATHILGGAAVGGYAAHRAGKLDPKGTKKDFKGHTNRVLGGAVAGGALGGMVGQLHSMTVPVFNEAAVKSIKERIKSRGHSFHDLHRAAGATVGGAVGGGSNYLWAKSHNKKQKDKKKHVDPRAAAVVGAGFGASLGHGAGSYARLHHLNGLQNAPAKAQIPSWLKGVKTKAEAKSAYRAQARKHHPDLGGNAEKFKGVQSDWEGFEKQHFNKLSHSMAAFLDELACMAEARR
jgi:hypothetical protein